MLKATPLLYFVTAALLTACASEPIYRVPPARVAGQAPFASAAEDEAAKTGEAESRPGLERLAVPPRTPSVAPRQDPSLRLPADNALTVAVEAMPLRDLINHVFGELLKVSYVVGEGIQGLDQPVTLNVQAPVSSRALFKLIADLLAARGAGITYKDGVYFVIPTDGKGKGTIPIGLGRNPGDVPDVAGKIMQIIPLRYGPSPSIERTSRELVDIQVFPDPSQSALFVVGEREAILKVMDVVRLLDQPSTRASAVGVINLTFVSGREFNEQLVTLLENEGIPAGLGRADGKNVAIVPLEQLGAIVVFASSRELLERVEFWARQIDRPSQGPAQQYFIYHPKFARASDLGESLAPLIGASDVLRSGNQARDTRSALSGGMQQSSGATGGSAAGTSTPGTQINQQNALRRDSGVSTREEQALSIKGEGLTLSVDPRSNSLIFYTTGGRYESLLPMVRRLDIPPKQILLEATIAEVTLTGEFAYGVEFAATNGRASAGTSGGLGLPSGGLALSYVDSVTDNVRIKLSSTNNLVNILSNPILVVRDGVEASIAVGNDVPTVGATASDPITSGRQITTVLYRKTGLNLGIRPTLNAQGLVVMEIAQNISNTVPGGSGVEGAPIFFDRAVTTEVVARSGQTVLLAGLISESRTSDKTSVPGLGRIPGLGWLFSSESRKKEKTELVLMITPRVIESPDEWDAIRGGLERALHNLRLPGPVTGSSGVVSPPAERGSETGPQGGPTVQK